MAEASVAIRFARGNRIVRAGLREVLTCLGLALYWPLWREPFLGTLYSSSLEGAYEARFVLCVALLVVGLVAMLAWRRIDLGGKLAAWLGLAGGVSVALSALLFLTLAEFGASFDLGVVPLFASTFFLVAGFVCLTFCWAYHLLSLPRETVRWCALVSFTSGFALGFIDLMPSLFRPLLVALPLLSGALLAWLLLSERADSDGRSANGETGESLLASGRGGRFLGNTSADNGLTVGKRDAWYLFDWRYRLGIIAACAVVVLLASCMRAVWMHDATGYAASPRAMITYAESFAIGLLYMVVHWRMQPEEKRFSICISITVLFLLAGLLLCSFAGVSAGLGAVSTAHTAAQFLLWLMVCDAICRPQVACGFGGYIAFNALVQIATLFVIPSAAAMTSVNSDSFAMPFSLCITVLLAVFAMVCAGMLLSGRWSMSARAAESSNNSAAADPVSPNPPAEGELDIALVLRERYALTEREAEVAALVARGNSVKRTAELLCLATSTVQGYMKIIYRKMDIHSRQELVDTVSLIVKGADR